MKLIKIEDLTRVVAEDWKKRYYRTEETPFGLFSRWYKARSKTAPNEYESAELIYNELLVLKEKGTTEEIDKIIGTNWISLQCSICGWNKQKVIEVYINETSYPISICKECVMEMKELFEGDKQ